MVTTPGGGRESESTGPTQVIGNRSTHLNTLLLSRCSPRLPPPPPPPPPVSSSSLQHDIKDNLIRIKPDELDQMNTSIDAPTPPDKTFF